MALYYFENEKLDECSDPQRRAYMSRLKPQLWGDGALQMNSGKRSAFSSNIEQAISEVKAAWEASNLSNVSSRYWGKVEFSVTQDPDASIQGLLGVAGDFESFLQFGSLRNGEVGQDGQVDVGHPTFTDTSLVDYSSAIADKQLVVDQLHGNVLSAWFDEDAADMSIQAIAASSENDGNQRMFFVFTDEKVYVFDFSTS